MEGIEGQNICHSVMVLQVLQKQKQKQKKHSKVYPLYAQAHDW